MSTITYRDTNIPYIETNPAQYDFIYPIRADILDSINFSPPSDGRYFKSGFGHRYFSTTTTKTDNHGGFDFWQHHVFGNQTFNDSNKTPIVCMCDGYISQVLHGPDSVMELTATGRSVRVTCDSSFQSLGFKIKINYRHLSSLGLLATMADTAAFGTISISKGDTIGRIGQSGTTTNTHLHLSTQTIHPVYGSAFVNTARLFDPAKHPGVLAPLTNAKVEYLHDWADSALFRVTWPYNQTINQFKFINQTDTIIFNKEDAYNTGAALRDQYDCLNNVEIYAYQFNGNLTAKARYVNEMNNMPANYPASPQRDTNVTQYGYTHIPITHDSVAFVYDFIVKNISPSHQSQNFKVKLSDVWGYTVEAQLQAPLAVHWLSFSAEDEQEKGIAISWTTSSEINNDYFIVERSTDGIYWEPLGQIDGQGNSNTPTDYRYMDSNPINGISYYRLKQTDYDGRFNYSEIKSILRASKFNVTVHPNPTRGLVYIKGKKKRLGALKIYNVLGMEVSLEVKITLINNNEIQADLSKLAAGVYLLHIGTGANAQHIKVLKK